MGKETKNFKESFVSFWEKVKAVFEYLPNKLNNIHEQKVATINVDSIAIPYRKLDCAKKMKDFGNGNKWIKLIISLVSILFIIFLWWVLGTYTNVEIFLSNPQTVVKTFMSRVEQGLYWEDLSYSLTRVLVGFSLATVVSIPVAFLMAWYRPVRAAIDPFIQFLRTIPPLAYIGIVIAALGNGEQPKYAVIFIPVFLTMTVTIFQGVKEVDLTLVKASYTFGAKDRNLFFNVIIPSAFPFILTAMRLGVGAALTTLIAAEMTGGVYGIGSMIQAANGQGTIELAMVGILTLGIFGFLFDRVLLIVEKLCTRWK